MASYIYAEVIPTDRDLDGMPCKCCRLCNGWDLPSPKPLEVEQIRSLATNFAYEIFADWTNLNATLKRFEALIQKRWLKKSAKQRRETLTAAYPHIPLVHRPDFENFRNYSNRHISRSRTCDAEAHLTPYMNLEDLMQGRILLLFINSRGRNLPSIFALSDAERAHLSGEWVERPEKDDFAMCFYDKKTPRQYASVVKVSAMPRRIGTAHSVTAAYGLVTLEIQQTIYRFLLRCVMSILHDIPLVDHKLAPFQTEPSPLQDPTGVWQSVSQTTLEADYCKPRAASLLSFKLLVQGLRLTAEDHVWSLRDDPSYFLETLREWREYHTDSPPETQEHWRDVAAQMLDDALDALHAYTWLYDILMSMRPLSDQIASANRNTLRLTAYEEFTWVLISKVVDSMIWKSMRNLDMTIPKSSGFRGHVQAPHDVATCKLKGRCPSPHGCESAWNLKKSATPAHSRAHKIFLMLSGNDVHGVQLHRLRPIVQEAHYMLETDPEASRLIDTCLLVDFFDLAVLADLQHCIWSLRPYSDSWIVAGMEYDVYVNKSQEAFWRRCTDLSGAVVLGARNATTLGDPLDGRFSYPLEKRRTAETVRQMQRAETTLKTFWDQMHVNARRYGTKLDAFFAWHLTSSPLAVRSTQDWDEKQASPTQLRGHPAGSSDDELDYRKLHTPLTGNENKKAEITLEERIKTKTRGEAKDQVDAVPQPDPQAAVASPTTEGLRKAIKVPRREFKVNCALLPSSTTISQAPREVSWNDFICALNTLGLVPGKLYGSVWIFKPVPAGHGLVRADRSIQFHEPKSVRHGNKIDARMVRRFGDRLKRAFGWDGETFVCA
jgi:hypothetical protein